MDLLFSTVVSSTLQALCKKARSYGDRYVNVFFQSRIFIIINQYDSIKFRRTSLAITFPQNLISRWRNAKTPAIWREMAR